MRCFYRVAIILIKEEEGGGAADNEAGVIRQVVCVEAARRYREVRVAEGEGKL